MRRRSVVFVLPLAIGLALVPTAPVSPAVESPAVMFAAPGRIEGAQPAVAVGAGITAIVREVLVGEGHVVAKGQLLVRLECGELIADLDRLEAEHRAAEAHAEVVRLGSRPEAIGAAAAELDLAKARWTEAVLARERSLYLARGNVGTKRDLQVAQRDELMAAAQHEAARRRLDLLLAGPRGLEIVEARARAVAAGRARDAAIARRDQCDIRSPIAGTVIGQPVLAGELVSTAAPRPIAVVADLTRLRVRAEVDETDVKRLQVVGTNHDATIVTGRGTGLRLPGRVVSVSQRMGRRQVLTNDPGERSDRDVLDVIVQLDPLTTDLGHIPVGLRVSVLFGVPRPVTSEGWKKR